MGRRGRKRQLDVEARYWELILAGVGTAQACKLVGIGRKTGYRWRAERGGRAPLGLDEAARSNRFLSRLERQRIATLRARLRTGRPLRRRRRRADRRRIRFVVPSKLIDQRPSIVEGRSRLGDWEGDLIVGRSSGSAIGTLVERRTGLLRLIHLPDGHGPDKLCRAIAPVLDTLPASARRTLTWDQGTEMARHDQLAGYFSDGIFFAYPASPWLRGCNENANGLLRQYFPKGTDLRGHPRGDLAHVENLLNTRPRKRLGWRTPADVFASRLGVS